MKIRLFKDSSISIQLDDIASNISRLAPHLTISVGHSDFSTSGTYISNPKTYRKLSQQILDETQADDYVFLFTEKPYDNNYFWDSDSSKNTIISLFGWDHLTSLSRNNGAVGTT